MRRSHEYILRRPLVTEKNMHRVETRNSYTFEVAPDANKIEIRQAAEKIFGVRVVDVRTMNVRGKRKRHGFNWHIAGGMKKAVITLKEGDKIDLL